MLVYVTHLPSFCVIALSQIVDTMSGLTRAIKALPGPMPKFLSGCMDRRPRVRGDSWCHQVAFRRDRKSYHSILSARRLQKGP